MSSAPGMRRMVRRGAAVFAAVLLCALVAAPGTAAGAAGDARLLSEGSAETYWVARVFEDATRGGVFVTDVYSRTAGGAAWGQIARVDGRAVQLAHRGGQLALLLDDGGWLLVSEDTVATGRPPPPGVRILSIATRDDTLVALGRVHRPGGAAGRAAAGAPAATAPTSAPSASDAGHLALFTLGPDGWAGAAGFDVSGAPPGTASDASLAIVEGTPIVAVRNGPNAVAVYRTPGDGRASPRVIPTDTPVVEFKLVGGPVPVLWTVEAEGPPKLHWFAPGGSRSVGVDVNVAGRRSPASAAYAIDRVRVVYGQGLVLSERAFDGLTGAPSGQPGSIRLPRTPTGPPLGDWLQSLLPVLLLFTIISSLRRRRQMQETMQAADQLPLAPFGRRLLAGVIDAIPVLATLALVFVWEKRAENAGEPLFETRSQLVALAGLLAYLLHTAVSEMVFGRTIGKLCCGLRVVGLDGRRPPATALLTRNLLRLIDLSMMFFPLVLVLYSPLRQRAGDVAAGTLVVLNRSGAEAVTDQAVDEAPAAEMGAKEKAAGGAGVID